MAAVTVIDSLAAGISIVSDALAAIASAAMYALICQLETTVRKVAVV